MAALKLLAKRRKLAKDYEVHCLLVQDDAARTVSLTENVQRGPCRPHRGTVRLERPCGRGAARGGYCSRFRCDTLGGAAAPLKLANVSPRLLADFGKQIVTLEQLMALAITDDHAAQEAALNHRNGSATRTRCATT